MFRKNKFSQQSFFKPQRSIVDILIIIAISCIVAFGIGSFVYMSLNSCDGFWVRDAMGVPRCVNSQNINILVH